MMYGFVYGIWHLENSQRCTEEQRRNSRRNSLPFVRVHATARTKSFSCLVLRPVSHLVPTVTWVQRQAKHAKPGISHLWGHIFLSWFTIVLPFCLSFGPLCGHSTGRTDFPNLSCYEEDLRLKVGDARGLSVLVHLKSYTFCTDICLVM